MCFTVFVAGSNQDRLRLSEIGHLEMKKLATRDSSAIAARIAAREPFETYGANRGVVSSGSYTGYLRRDGAELWHRDWAHTDYVVLSYSTPVAWHTPEHGWVYVDRNFSVTSSKHQSAARYGIQLDTDNRKTAVMVDYRLTAPQSALLYSIREAGSAGVAVKGQQNRTVGALLRSDLVVNSRFGRYILTEKGAKVFA